MVRRNAREEPVLSLVVKNQSEQKANAAQDVKVRYYNEFKSAMSQ